MWPVDGVIDQSSVQSALRGDLRALFLFMHKITDSKITTMKSDESFTETAAGNHAYTDEQFKQQQNYRTTKNYE